MTQKLKPETIKARAELIEQGVDPEAINAYIELGFVDDDLSDFEEAYSGEYSSDEEFAQDMAEQIGAIDKNASWPTNCIDWEQASSELMYDYSEENGHYFRNI